MMTKIYGQSDDLVEIEGDIFGEVGYYNDENPTLLFCSDGTILKINFGKADLAIWEIGAIQEGALLMHITPCTDEDAEPYSDIALFKDGLRWIYAAAKWERVK